MNGVRPPRLLEASIVTFRCSGCESDILARLELPKGKREPGQSVVKMKILRPSSVLIEILKEEEEMRKKSIEELDEISDKARDAG